MITVERLDAGLFGVYLVSLSPPRQAGGGPSPPQNYPGPLTEVEALDGIEYWERSVQVLSDPAIATCGSQSPPLGSS